MLFCAQSTLGETPSNVVEVVLRSAAALLALAFVVAGPAPRADALTLFSETFDGYTSFPDQDPPGDPVNLGLPSAAKGADYDSWLGARFQGGSGDGGDGSQGALDLDLAVQSVGGLGNNTPVGRMKDDAGMIFQIDTQGVTDVVLDFSWRTFRTECILIFCDKLKVGYFVGDISEFSGSDYADLRSGPAAWSNWTQLLAEESENAWVDESFALPEGESSVYVAFWLDDGNKDYGKIDNILVTAVPEPSSAILIGVGLALIAARKSEGRKA